MLNKHPVAGNTIRNITQKEQATTSGQTADFNVEMENGSVGMLLAVKAFVQLLFNPIVGNLSGKFGYQNIIFIGTISLLLSSLSEFGKSNSISDVNFIILKFLPWANLLSCC